jgi:hypothetical protein
MYQGHLDPKWLALDRCRDLSHAANALENGWMACGKSNVAVLASDPMVWHRKIENTIHRGFPATGRGEEQ